MPNAEKPSPVRRRGPGRAWNGLDRLTRLGRRLLGRGRFWLRRLLRRGLHDSPPSAPSQALYPSGDERKHPGDQRADRRDQRGIGALSKYGLYHRNKGLGRPRDPQVPLAAPGAVGGYWMRQYLRVEPRRGTRSATPPGAQPRGCDASLDRRLAVRRGLPVVRRP